MSVAAIRSVPVPAFAIESFAVTVARIAEKTVAVRRFDHQILVDDFQGFLNKRVVRRLNSEPDELKKSRVENFALVECSRTVVELDFIAGVRFAVLRDPQVIIAVAVFSGSRRRPFFEIFCPVIGGFQVSISRRFIAVEPSDFRGADQTGDFRGDG